MMGFTALSGVLGIVVGQFLLFSGLQKTTPTNASIIRYFSCYRLTLKESAA